MNQAGVRTFHDDEEELMTLQTSQASRKSDCESFPMRAWEPTLEEMLSEPVVQMMMMVDGVQPDDVVTLLRRARDRLD